MSQSSAVETSLTIFGLVICSVEMSTWLLICVMIVLQLIWCVAIFLYLVFVVLIVVAVDASLVLVTIELSSGVT